MVLGFGKKPASKDDLAMAGVQEQLMQDPEVKAALAKAGENALKDPKVQEEMIKVAKEKFPEYAGQVQSQVTQWANDPEVQAKAKYYGGQALAYAGAAAGDVAKMLESGPDGVRFVACCVGIASCVNAVMSLINIFSALFSPIMYLIAAYQFVFSCTTVVFEMPQDWIDKHLAFVKKYQDMLMVKAAFLADVLGRGLFYLFQGSLWLGFSSVTEILDLGCGLALIFIGVLHILMHFGIMPKHVFDRARDQYSRLQQPGATGSA